MATLRIKDVDDVGESTLHALAGILIANASALSYDVADALRCALVAEHGLEMNPVWIDILSLERKDLRRNIEIDQTKLDNAYLYVTVKLQGNLLHLKQVAVEERKFSSDFHFLFHETCCIAGNLSEAYSSAIKYAEEAAEVFPNVEAKGVESKA